MNRHGLLPTATPKINENEVDVTALDEGLMKSGLWGGGVEEIAQRGETEISDSTAREISGHNRHVRGQQTALMARHMCVKEGWEQCVES